MRPEQLLRIKQLSVTRTRLTILDIMLAENKPVDRTFFLRSGRHCNRITLYRTLKLLVKEKLLHIIPTTDEKIWYGLLIHNDNVHQLDTHPHFVCVQCHKTVCLHSNEYSSVKIPEGYLLKNIIINGLCADCSTKSRQGRNDRQV